MESDIKLTREEVDALINVAGALEGSMSSKDQAQAARSYDFRRPDTMSKDHERTMGMVNTNFARHMAGMLSTLLRGMVAVDVQGYVETEYQQFNRDLPNLSLMAVCSIPPTEGKILFTLAPQFSMILVDRLLGGPGQAPKDVRELTEIELALMRQVMNRVLISLKESLENIVPIEPVIDQLEPNPAFVQLVSATSHVIVIKLQVTMRNAVGMMRLCIPYQVLKPLLPILHEHFWMRGRGSNSTSIQAAPEVRTHLSGTGVSLSLQLGEASISVGDLLNLQVGDCVVLDKGEEDELRLLVAGKHHLWGRLGVKDDAYAVKVTRWKEKDDDDLEDGSDEP